MIKLKDVVLCLIALLVFVTRGEADEPVRITVDASKTGEAVKPIWAYFGYDECNLTTSEDGRALLTDLGRVFRNQKPPHIRMHFLLCSGDGKFDMKWGSTNVYTEDEQGQPVYDWKLLDEIVDTVVQAGCAHHFQFGFMPQALADPDMVYKDTGPKKRGKQFGLSNPPVDYKKWASVIENVAKRYTKCIRKHH